MSIYLKHVRNRVIVKGVERSGKVWLGEPIEETRQEYATIRVQELQLAWNGTRLPYDFNGLLGAFRDLGQLYDEGYRLRDSQAGAA